MGDKPFIDLAAATQMDRVGAPGESQVIGIHDGARHVGWIDAMQDVSSMVSALARAKAASGLASDGYATALNDVLNGMQGLMAEKRKT